MNPDFIDLLAALLRAQARFIVVGAHALSAHGVSRATGDMDLWIETGRENVDRVWQALTEFGAPLRELNLSTRDLAQPDMVIQLGLPPRRIDILTSISGVTFEEAWNDRFIVRLHDLDIPFLGRAAFIQNKRATGRLKDLADLEALGEQK